MMWSRLFSWKALKNRVVRSLDQHASPRQLALSFAIGVFCSLLPFPGHTFVAAALAFGFRLNLLAAVAGTWINLPPIIPFTYGFAFFVGELATRTDMPDIVWRRFLDVRYWWPLFRAYFLTMAVGTTLVGAAGAVSAYFVALRIAYHLREKRLRRKVRGTDAEVARPLVPDGCDESR